MIVTGTTKMNMDTTFWLLSIMFLKIFSISAKIDILIVCYYRSSSLFRSGDAKYGPKDIDPNLCTHLIYTFSRSENGMLLPFNETQQEFIDDFVRLKTYNNKLKTLITIGGIDKPPIFSSLVENAERRNAFVKATIQFLRENNFDGLDLDWEDPAYGDGSKPVDRINYARFVQEIREEFDRESLQSGQERLLLTITISGNPDIIDQGYDVPKLNEHVDWFNVKAFKYHDSSESIANHHAPLKLTDDTKEKLSFEFSAKYLIDVGASRKKLVLGVPTFGISYTLSNPILQNTIGSPVYGPGQPGRDTGVAGFLAYFEICQLINNDNFTVVTSTFDELGTYIFKGNQWISFNDQNTVLFKGVYVAKNGFRGLMFWSIDTDDFQHKCSPLSYPLIKAGKEGIEKVYPTSKVLYAPPIAEPKRTLTKNSTKVKSTVTTPKTTTTANQPIKPFVITTSRPRVIPLPTTTSKPTVRPSTIQQTTQFQSTTSNDNYDGDGTYDESDESYESDDNDAIDETPVIRATFLINELFELVEEVGGADQFRKLVDSIPSDKLKTKINITKLFRDDISNQKTDFRKFNPPPAVNGDRSTGYRFALQRQYEDGTLTVFVM